MDKMLDREIDDTLAEYILNKVQEHKVTLQAKYQTALAEAKSVYGSKLEKSFSFVKSEVAKERAAIREEYSAKLVSVIEEKNTEISDLHEDYDRMKEELAENVQTFLQNSKDELRGLVAEEMRLDSNELKAQSILEQIKDLVGRPSAPVLAKDNSGEVTRLSQEVGALKERVEKDRKVKETYKAQLRRNELIESVPSADRSFYLSEMATVSTVDEVEEAFARIQKAVKKANVRRLEEELEDSKGRGSDLVEEEVHDWTEERQVSESGDWITDRMKQLARI